MGMRGYIKRLFLDEGLNATSFLCRQVIRIVMNCLEWLNYWES